MSPGSTGTPAQPPVSVGGPVTAPATLNGMNLVWSDEFDTPGRPDPSKWVHDIERNRQGWYNNELQYYAGNRLENARVENGRLIITARQERLSSAPDHGGQDSRRLA